MPEYNLYGVIDNLEIENYSGEDLSELRGNEYKITIVEFKPTMPAHKEYNYEDLMQVFAQKICVDYMFSCDCECEIYYSDKNRRVKLPFREDYQERDRELKDILAILRAYIRNGTIPPKDKLQNCNGCSMTDLCMPKHKKAYHLMNEVYAIKNTEEIEGGLL